MSRLHRNDSVHMFLHKLYKFDVIDKFCDDASMSSDDDNNDKDNRILASTMSCLSKKLDHGYFNNNKVVKTIIGNYQLADTPINHKILQDKDNPLEAYSNENFENQYHFTKSLVFDILQMIMYGLKKYTNRGHPIPPINQLLITLKFLVSGTYQRKIQNLRVSQPTISRIIRKVTGLLAELKLRFIKIPERIEFKNISDKFLVSGNFPEVFGCIGSTHIPIKSPNKSIADAYLNDKGFHSFCTMLMCGPNLEIYEIISRWPGSINENKIFNLSEIHQRFIYEQMDGVLLANRNYKIRNFLMTPIDNPKEPKEFAFNEAHRKTYCLPAAIELWKRRFKCLQLMLCNKEDTIQNIIQTCAVLHNIAIQQNHKLSTVQMISEITEIPINKDNIKRIVNNFQQHEDPLDILDRNYFIRKHF